MSMLRVFKPGRLAVAMIVFAAIELASGLLRLGGEPPAWGGVWAIIPLVEKVAAYSIALALCLGIVAEYRQKCWLRFAWMCLAVNSAVSVVRYLFDTQVIEAIDPGYWHGQLITVMREVPSAIALLFLAVGIVAMAVAFLRTGLGFSLSKMDWLAMAGVSIFVVLILYLRDDLSAASRLEHWIPRQAQLASHIFFGVAAAGAIVLLRLSIQMGGGRLAAAMTWIIAHIATRSVLVLVWPFVGNLAFIPHVRLLESIIYGCAPWMFAMAAAHRYQLTRMAAEQAAQWGIELQVSEPAGK